MDTYRLTVAAVSVLARTRENWFPPATPAAECYGQSRQAVGRLGIQPRPAKDFSALRTGLFRRQ
jgi:hypothetical protein